MVPNLWRFCGAFFWFPVFDVVSMMLVVGWLLEVGWLFFFGRGETDVCFCLVNFARDVFFFVRHFLKKFES